jgi:uncharacterized membrane protein YhaH (DUF805 family)
MDWRSLFFSFSGRINRAKFWIAWLVLMIAFVIAFLLAATTMSTIMWSLAIVVFVAVTFCGLAVGAKRLHDRDRSAWWLALFYLGPGLLQAMGEAMGGIGVIFLVVSIGISIWALVALGFLRGTEGPNRFGPDPLAGAGTQPAAGRVS